MATGIVNFRRIYTRSNLAPGQSQTVAWNNPPAGTVLSYFTYAVPPTASGPHGSSRGVVELTRVQHEYRRDNYGGDTSKAHITVKNTGDGPTGYEVWQSWITPS